MRRLLFLLIIFLPFVSFGQSIIIQGNDHTMIQNKGGFQADSVLFIPHRNDNAWYGRYGDLRINPNTGNLEFRKGGQWVEVSSSSNIPHQYTQEFAGQPAISANHYTLDFTPLQSTVIIYVNGVALPRTWYSIGANEFYITTTFYPIDNTDIIRASYTYF